MRRTRRKPEPSPREPGRKRPLRLADAVTALALLTVFLAGFHSLVDPDIWFHLRAGQEISASGSIPRVDTFSYPSAGRPYVDLHWLFQVLAYRVHSWAGEAGLTWMTCLVLLGAFSLIHRLTRRAAPAALAAALTALGAVLASERFEPRPEILSFLFLALVLWLLRRHLEGWRRAVWLLPPLFLLWVNCEGLFVLGYLVLLAQLLDRPGDRRLWLGLGLSLLATLVNPYFIEGAVHPLVLFSRINRSLPIYSATIGEFLSPFRGAALHPSVALFPWYLGLIALALLLRGRWPRRGEILLLAAFVYLAVSARRNVALLPLAVTPILGRWLDKGRERLAGSDLWSRRGVEARRRWMRGAEIALLVAMGFYDLALVTDRVYTRAETNRCFGTSPAPVAFARGAARFLREERLPGPVFSTFAAGSFLTYAYPQEKVFIDGRLEVHSAEHYERYLGMLRGGEAWSSADRQYGFNVAVMQYMDAMPLVLERLRDPAWAPVYLDDTAVIFLRRSPGNEALIKDALLTPSKLRAAFPSVEADGVEPALNLPAASPGLSPMRLFGPERIPWSQMNLGQFFLQVNRAGLAVPQFASAARLSPGLAAPRVWLAASLNQLGRPRPGLEILDAARSLDGFSRMKARYWTIRGDLLTSLSRPAEAVAAYARCLEDPPSPEQVPTVLASRALARLQAGDPEGAFADIDASLRMLPANLQAYWILGRIEEARGRGESAVRAYERFKAMGGRSAEVDAALGRLGGR